MTDGPTLANEGDQPQDAAWVYERPGVSVVGSFSPDVAAAPGYRKAGDGPRQKAKGSVRITVEEAGVLQSFYRHYPWKGSRTKAFQQVGNAVCPRMAAHVIAAAIGCPTDGRRLIDEEYDR